MTEEEVRRLQDEARADLYKREADRKHTQALDADARCAFHLATEYRKIRDFCAEQRAEIEEEEAMTERTKHTPGPWRVSWAGNEPPGLFLVHEAKEDRDAGTRSANARLIAAAPEMLDALREVLPVLTNPNGRAFNKVLDAIARAEGRDA